MAICIDLPSWGDLEKYATIGAKVLEDPYLPEVAEIVLKIADLNTGPTSPTPDAKGVGLHDFIFPLKLYVWTKEQPWLVVLSVLGLVAVPVFAGVILGRSMERKTCRRTGPS